MIIISDCFTDKIDEGCLKVANSLTKRIKQRYPDTTIISYGRKSNISDMHLKLNKLFLNKELISLIRKKNESVLYIPFSSNTGASILRVFILSLFAKKDVKVIFTLRHSMNSIFKKILKFSNAEVIAMSSDSYDYFSSEIGVRCTYLKTGVDTKRFCPVDNEEKLRLREKYNVTENKKVLLHVGHLKSGRNVDKLLNASEDYHVFLVVSSVTEKEDDLRERLSMRPYTTVIDTYLENIQEVYQMADVYLFPVQQAENCIDVPLSVMEAASCNVAVVTSEYGELKTFKSQPGFKFIDSFEAENLNAALDEMSNMENINNRKCVKEYDWNYSVDKLF